MGQSLRISGLENFIRVVDAARSSKSYKGVQIRINIPSI
jgi:hypothetical protein